MKDYLWWTTKLYIFSNNHIYVTTYTYTVVFSIQDSINKPIRRSITTFGLFVRAPLSLIDRHCQKPGSTREEITQRNDEVHLTSVNVALASSFDATLYMLDTMVFASW